MSAKLIRRLLLGLFVVSTAVVGADALPGMTVKSHAVDLSFPAESVVEAV